MLRIYMELLGDQMEYVKEMFGYERRIHVTSRQTGMTNRFQYFIEKSQKERQCTFINRLKGMSLPPPSPEISQFSPQLPNPSGANFILIFEHILNTLTYPPIPI